jgi:hypothetical protein
VGQVNYSKRIIDVMDFLTGGSNNG